MIIHQQVITELSLRSPQDRKHGYGGIPNPAITSVIVASWLLPRYDFVWRVTISVSLWSSSHITIPLALRTILPCVLLAALILNGTPRHGWYPVQRSDSIFALLRSVNSLTSEGVDCLQPSSWWSSMRSPSARPKRSWLLPKGCSLGSASMLPTTISRYLSPPPPWRVILMVR